MVKSYHISQCIHYPALKLHLSGTQDTKILNISYFLMEKWFSILRFPQLLQYANGIQDKNIHYHMYNKYHSFLKSQQFH